MNRIIEKNLDFLKLFIKKSKELDELSYFEKGNRIVTEEYHKDDNGEINYEIRYPNNEQKKALLLTLRMFWQKKDRVYYRKFLDFYREIPFSNEWKSDVRRIFFILDLQLDSWYIESPKEKRLSYKALFEIFLYGDEAHLDKEKREKFLEFTRNETVKSFNESTFHKVILDLSNVIFELARISIKELENLGISID